MTEDWAPAAAVVVVFLLSWIPEFWAVRVGRR